MQGGDCFGEFMRWGLPKAVLKDIWALVAGERGQLSQREWLACLYLMDLAAQGIPPPSMLPPGVFPPFEVASPDGLPARPGTAGRAFSLADVQQVQALERL